MQPAGSLLKNVSRPTNRLDEPSYSGGNCIAVEPASGRFSEFFNSPLARKIFHLIRSEPLTTTELRKALPPTTTLTKSALDRALIELQVTLNIVRSNAPEVKNDTWLRFTDQYPEFRDIKGQT